MIGDADPDLIAKSNKLFSNYQYHGIITLFQLKCILVELLGEEVSKVILCQLHSE